MHSLSTLPDEILLEVVRHFGPIRSFETQSEAFKRKRREKERQCENHIRQQTLYALCLTSHRLRYLSLPTLYSSCSTCATRNGLRQLQLLHRTFGDPNNSFGQTKPLAEHLQYIENRLADFRGNSLQGDEVFQQQSVATYFQLLAGLVLCAPNLEHLCVVSLEHEDVSFWADVLGNSQGPLHWGSAKLAHLSAQIHTYAWSPGPEAAMLERVLQHIRSLPVLSELRISGATTSGDYALAFKSDEITNLRRLGLAENNLEIVEVANLVLACKNLRHFTCKWEFVKDTQVGPSVLHPALLARAETLETLTLDWREVRHSSLVEPGSAMIGTLKPLKNLRSLEICELGFLTDHYSLLDLPSQAVDTALSDLLPKNLEQMTLLTKGEMDLYQDNVLENAVSLWQFSNDCSTSVPHLKTFCIKSEQSMRLPSLTKAMAKVGVHLRTEIDI